MDRPEASARESSDAKLIANAQTEMKALVEESVRFGRSTADLKERCEKLTNKLLDELKNADTREKTREAMQTYARDLFKRFMAFYGAMRAMTAILKKQGIVKKVRSDGLPVGGLPLSVDPLSYNMETAAQIDFATYHRMAKQELNRILTDEARPDYGERNINMRLIAELNVRYEKQMDMIKGLAEDGEDLVWIEPHANASKRCEPWQSKLYSISGKQGKTAEGVPYQPLSNATDVRVTTKSGKTYLNGCVTGFGCRHKLTPYRPGNKPIMIPAEVVERQRAAEQKQRALERSIRYEKDKAATLRAIDPEEAKKAREKAHRLTKAYEQFSRSHDLPAVRTRTSVMPGEDMFKRNSK